MKYIITTFLTIIALSLSVPSYAGGEIKEVCKDKVDAAGKAVVGKDGKAIRVCKKIKVHKKLEGTKVPDKK